MIVLLVLLAIGIWVLCLMVRVIGIRATKALVYLGLLAFILAAAWEVFKRDGPFMGIFSAVTWVGLSAFIIAKEESKPK